MVDHTTLESAASAIWTTRDYFYAAGVSVAVISACIAGFSAFKTSKRDLNSLGDSEIKTFEMIAKAEKDFAEFNSLLRIKLIHLMPFLKIKIKDTPSVMGRKG